MNKIVVIGASGFIGKHLLTELLRLGGFSIKILSRSGSLYPNDLTKPGVEVVSGDLCDPESIRSVLESGCTVINLVYLAGATPTKNLTFINNLLDACKAVNVRRLIHLSTADVLGRARGNLVTDSTPCQPVTEYGVTKLKIENTMLMMANDSFDIAILRPTAVFGPGGKNLKKLANDLATKSRLLNYLRSSLYNKRRMNLVSVANVVAAIIFLTTTTKSLHGRSFIISDDSSPANNFCEVEHALMQALGIPAYNLPRLPVPPAVLSVLLACLGKNSVNPLRNHSSNRLLELGFQKAGDFETELLEYAAWYQSSNFEQESDVT